MSIQIYHYLPCFGFSISWTMAIVQENEIYIYIDREEWQLEYVEQDKSRFDEA